MKLLLDTNVLIDFLGRKPPFFENAQRIVAAGYFGDAQLWAPAQSFRDAFYVLSHFADPHRVQAAMGSLLEIVNLVDLTGADMAKAIRLDWDDFEDCLVAVSAQKVGADYLITRDAKGFGQSMVPAKAPTAWLDLVRESEGVAYGAVNSDNLHDRS